MKKYLIPLLLVIGLLSWKMGKSLYMKPSYGRGEIAPNIEATLLSGQRFNLKDKKGKFTLLNFWGSWCGPCRKENQELLSLYQDIKKKKISPKYPFEIVSIGVETHTDRWQRAIAKDGLLWQNHILDQASSLRFFDSPIAQTYGVKEVPTTFLLNPAGEIVGINLTFPVIKAILTGKINEN